MHRSILLSAILSLATVPARVSDWPPPQAPVIENADGYVDIPGAAVAPEPRRVYRVLFDANRAAARPGALAPAINAAGGIQNDLAVGHVPITNVRMAIVFHGAAVNAILDDAHYRAKYRMANPNLDALAKLRRRGVELFVCGQHLAAERIDPRTLSPDVKIASDAWLVLVTYQNQGYALMTF